MRRKLPLLADIIERLYENSDAEWLIYTNVDIAVQPHFYESVASIIGDARSNLDPRLADMRKFNRHVFGEIWQSLRPENPGLETLKPEHLRRIPVSWRSLEKASGEVFRSTMPESAFEAVRSAYRKVWPPNEPINYFDAPDSTLEWLRTRSQ